MPPTTRLHDTYVAALQHDLVDLLEETTLVGVVRRPTGWFNAAVDENAPAVAPPATLLNAFEDREETFTMRGICAEEAHNAAWEAVDFTSRYRRHLHTAQSAQQAVAELCDRLRAGESLTLVCFENTDAKRCRRTILRAHLLETFDDE
jgi:uncharacterized protein YeaO (DUF488 family)